MVTMVAELSDFRPLGMADTGFVVPESKLSRFGTNHQFDADAGRFMVVESPRPRVEDLIGIMLIQVRGNRQRLVNEFAERVYSAVEG